MTAAALRAKYHGPTDAFGFPIGTLDDQYEFCIVVDLEVLYRAGCGDSRWLGAHHPSTITNSLASPPTHTLPGDCIDLAHRAAYSPLTCSPLLPRNCVLSGVLRRARRVRLPTEPAHDRASKRQGQGRKTRAAGLPAAGTEVSTRAPSRAASPCPIAVESAAAAVKSLASTVRFD